MEATSTTHSSSLSNSFLIDKSNGSVYFNFLAFNITDLDQLQRFRGTYRLVVGARDSALTLPLAASQALNLTLYLNYDLAELGIVDEPAPPPPSVLLRSHHHHTDTLSDAEFDPTRRRHTSTSAARNFFQLVSNGVLLIILITVLMFMLFVACFLFIIFYKKNSSSGDHHHDHASGSKTMNIDKLSYELSNGKLIKKKNQSGSKHGPNSSSSSSCLGHMRTRLKLKCGLVKSSSLANLNAATLILSKKNEDNLTVFIKIN